MTNVRVTQFYKTKTCPWYSKGRCERANACRFAHNDLEKRKLPNLCKTSVCNFMVKNGYCDTPNCRFAHQYDELRATDGIYKTSLCFMFMKSRCNAGIFCRHAHGPQELRTFICPQVIKKSSASSFSENKVSPIVDMEKKTKNMSHCVPSNNATISNNVFFQRKASKENVGQVCTSEKASMTPVKCKSHPINFFVSSQRSPVVPNYTYFFFRPNFHVNDSLRGNDCKQSGLPLNDKTQEITLMSDSSCCSTSKKKFLSLEKDIETKQYNNIAHDEPVTKKTETLMAYPSTFKPSLFFSEPMPLYENEMNGLNSENNQTQLINKLSNQDTTRFLEESIVMSVDNLNKSFVDDLRTSFYEDSQILYLPKMCLESNDNKKIQQSYLQTLEKQDFYEKSEDEKANIFSWDPFRDKNNDSAFFSFSFENNTQEKNLSFYHLNKTPNSSYQTKESMTFETLFNESNPKKELFNKTQIAYDWQYDGTCKSAGMSFENDFSTQCPSNNSGTSVVYETHGSCPILPHIGTLHNCLVPIQETSDCYLTKEEDFFPFLTKNDSSTFCDSRQSSFSKKSSVSQTDLTPTRKYGYSVSEYNGFDKQLFL